MSSCGFECHTIGGPWIAENPSCPIHGDNSGEYERKEYEARIGAAVLAALDDYTPETVDWCAEILHNHPDRGHLQDVGADILWAVAKALRKG